MGRKAEKKEEKAQREQSARLGKEVLKIARPARACSTGNLDRTIAAFAHVQLQYVLKPLWYCHSIIPDRGNRGFGRFDGKYSLETSPSIYAHFPNRAIIPAPIAKQNSANHSLFQEHFR